MLHVTTSSTVSDISGTTEYTTVSPGDSTTMFSFFDAWKYWPYSRLWFSRAVYDRRKGKTKIVQTLNVTAFEVVRQELYGNKSGLVCYHPKYCMIVRPTDLEERMRVHTVAEKFNFWSSSPFFKVSIVIFGLVCIVGIFGKLHVY